MTARTWTHPTEGWTLRGDAAASYLRMRAAGMPAGGIDVFSRTMAQQTALRAAWEAGRGPLAARATPTAPHIDGRAMDAHTTTAGRYAPSAAHVWLSHGGRGDLKPQTGESLRAHTYGWRRTVPSERWHWEYSPERDTKRAADLAARLDRLGMSSVSAYQRSRGLTADGTDGPVTWAALLSETTTKTTTTAEKGIFMALSDAQQARLVEAADRIMGMMQQRRDADGGAARVLDSLDGGHILEQLAEQRAATIAELLDTRIPTSWGTGTVREALSAALELRDVPTAGGSVRLDEAVGQLLDRTTEAE